ncbi:TPA: hypothetical protein ACPSKY_003311 [Legionella bozemanae]|uniref:hypothetical protein n=1 Tax=Legionella bozemanae TaxID=447 RepID=UPI00104169DD|nr:hypothetical protein [Legionella bozemanae]
MGKVIRVASIDFDGCLSHQDYINQMMHSGDRVQACINSNPVLIQKLQEMQIDKVIVGSNRQDVYMDISNAKNHKADGPGSCFPLFKALSQEVGAKFDGFLMGDIYSEKAHGHTLQGAEKLLKQRHQYETSLIPNTGLGISKWINDENKISLIYAQIQKLALEHPEDQIEFSFFDDREDILEAVERFFENNKELIPGNVKIKTFRYYDQNEKLHPASMQLIERKEITSSPDVKPNPHFETTLRNWGKQNVDPEDELSLDKKKNAHASLKSWHQFPIEMSSSFKTRLSTIMELTKTSAKSVHTFQKEHTTYKSLEEYKQALVDIYLECWDKEYSKTGFSIGYSAVLRGITKELEHEPQLLQMVKDDVRSFFQNDSSKPHPVYSTYSVSNNFRIEEFERDWDKYTGAKVNIFQKAAKTIMLQFKKIRENQEETLDEQEHSSFNQH